MNYKTLSQVFLILLALFVSSLFYFTYFYKKDNLEVPENNINNNENEPQLSKGNTVKDILYESFDAQGNNYTIKSDFGTFSEGTKEEIVMTNVIAKIILKNGATVDLKSKNAKYNTLNNDTNFFNDVELDYLDHKVRSDNIDVFFTDSKLEAYNNLVYRNSDIDLIADKVELDLLTKNTKIFMFDNSEVKIIKD